MNNAYLNKQNINLLEIANKHSDIYQNATPFPNISFSDFFNSEILNEVLEEFPDLSEKKESKKHNNSKEIKFGGKGERYFGTETKNLMHFLNSEPFLEFLQRLTGIKETLIPDPYFFGGGQHEIKRGGLLKIHADFNKHDQLKLDRRINVLVYLNKDWKEEYGGHFELWNKEMTQCEKKILPTFNTLAIFSTTSHSYHGHPNPLNCPENKSRKSLALYYYTNGRPQEEFNEFGKHSTLFVARKGNIEDKEAFKETTINKRATSSILKYWVKELTPPIVIRIGKKVLKK